jgi:sigma-B regulation protein RsbU (phosphoserine phosphatase)
VQIEETLKEERRQLSAILNSMNEGVMFFDLQGNVFYMNPVGQELFRYGHLHPAEQNISQFESLFDLYTLTGERLPTDKWPIYRVIQGENFRDVEIEVYRKETGEHWFGSYNGTQVQDEAGNALLGVLTVRDISEHVQFERAIEQDRRFAEALESISAIGISAMDLQQMLSVIIVKTVKTLNAHSGHILLQNQETGELMVQAEFDVDGSTNLHIKEDDDFIQQILKNHRTIYIADVTQDPLQKNQELKNSGIKSILGVPMIVRGKPLGVIIIDTLEIREFSREEIRLFNTIAARVGLIIENARLFGEVIQSREKINEQLVQLQRSLLPPENPKSIPGYQIGTTYIPGTIGLEIGGDFYDVFYTETGKIAFLIGDVSGKGIEAAAFASATRNTLRAFAYDLADPGDALTHANSVLYPLQQEIGNFVTVYLAILDPETGRVCYSSAGHPPPALYRAGDRSIEFPSTINPPLAIVDRVTYLQQELILYHGDKIILYTDGLSEARHGVELFEQEGIAQVLEPIGSQSPESIMNQLIQAATEWAGGNLTDDLALLVLERRSTNSTIKISQDESF